MAMAKPEPDIACLSCSKPIQPGTGILLESGGAVHIRCLSGALRLRAIEAQSTASKLKADALELIAIARRLATCIFCRKPLATGSLLFSGQRLVHAACWRSPGAAGIEDVHPEPTDAPSDSSPLRPPLWRERKGARARTTTLTPEERRAIASEAANTRWAKANRRQGRAKGSRPS